MYPAGRLLCVRGDCVCVFLCALCFFTLMLFLIQVYSDSGGVRRADVRFTPRPGLMIRSGGVFLP